MTDIIINRPKMIPIRWIGCVDERSLPGYWKHLYGQIWWVLPSESCTHITIPVMRRSARVNGPVVVPCYQCAEEKE